MIVKMRKYAFMVYHKNYINFVESLRNVGVLHVKESSLSDSESEVLIDKMQNKARLTKAITIAKSVLPKDVEIVEKPLTNADLSIIDECETLLSQKEKVAQKISALKVEAERMKVWGEFSNEQLQKLAEEGFKIKFFSIPVSKYDQEWEEKYNAFIVEQVGSQLYFVTVTKEDIAEIDADSFPFSKYTYKQLESKAEVAQKELLETENALAHWAVDHLSTLEYLMLEVERQIDWEKVILSSEEHADSSVKLLEGFCPVPAEEELVAMLEKEGVLYFAEDPDMSENIPIKLKNGFFSRLFEPVTKLFSLPNYGELDPTPFLAPFFLLFSGLCFGDGGYGLLILIATTALKIKMKDSPMKPFLTLGQYLGAMTLGVGILTGAFFGISLDSVTWSWLVDVKHLFLTSKNYKGMLSGYDPMMILAVIVGLIQIFFGMGIKAAKITKQHGIKYAYSNIAWIVALLASGTLYGLSALEVSLPDFVTYAIFGLIGFSAAAIFFYNSPGKNIFMNFGSGLWDTYNMASGLLGDTLSYIRLFALGLTGSILGGVFNTLAFDLTMDLNPFIRWFAVLIILLAGHAINFGLCLIGAFVHPLRLTFVEFYKNAGFEGGGREYKPFK